MPSSRHTRPLLTGVVPVAPLLLLVLLTPPAALAHPLVQDALDVVVAPDHISINARISMEQVLVAGAKGGPAPPADRWAALIRDHGPYALRHLRVTADGSPVAGRWAEGATPAGVPSSENSLIDYHFEYALSRPPSEVRIDQNFLAEFAPWSASCALRVRQSNQDVFLSQLLTRDGTVAFDCHWPPAPVAGHAPAPTVAATRTDVPLGPTFRAYMAHGIMHILTGYDHLLFVSALVLAAQGFWDLIKVVTAFTLAHTLTLTLSVFHIFSLGERIVEPMIAASIIFVAVQNLFWPERSRGWVRLAVAFAFGLFHGLGFAGGLQEAMSDLPAVALWTALIAFSLGVEIGHQIVVLPLFAALQTARHWKADRPRTLLMGRMVKAGSLAISVAGVYFLIQALQLPSENGSSAPAERGAAERTSTE